MFSQFVAPLRRISSRRRRVPDTLSRASWIRVLVGGAYSESRFAPDKLSGIPDKLWAYRISSREARISSPRISSRMKKTGRLHFF